MTRKTRTTAILATFVLVALAGMIFVARTWFPSEGGNPVAALNRESRPDSNTVPVLPTPQPVEVDQPDQMSVAEVADLGNYCPDLRAPLAERLSPLGGFTPACEAALDRRYLDLTPVMPITAGNGSFTWRRIFAQPLEKRRKTIKALQHSCEFNDGTSSESEDACDLNTLAEFGLLKYQCGGRQFHMLNRITPGIAAAVAEAELDGTADNFLYWERRWEVEDGYYRNAWLAAKCARIPEAALGSLVPEDEQSAFPGPRGAPPWIANVRSFRGTPESGQEGWWWAEQVWEATQIMAYAFARDQRHQQQLAMAAYSYTVLEPGSSQQEHPLQAEIVQLKRRGAWQPSWETNRPTRLMHAYMALVWASAMQIDLDRNWLFAQVGRFSQEEWENAKGDAHRIMDAQGRNLVLAEVEGGT